MADAPDTLDDIRADLERGLELLASREDEYLTHRAYYDGTRAEVAATREVERIINASAQAAPLGLAHIPVDFIVDKVELSGIVANDAAADAALATIADANDLDDEGDEWIRKAGYFADYYAIIDPTEEGDDETGRSRITPEGIRWVGSSPLTTVVVYDRKDGRTKLYGVKRWQGKGKRWHALMYYDDCTVKLVTPSGVDKLEAAKFEYDGDEADARIAHEGGRMLIAHLPIGGKPYGTPLHAKAFGPQDAITKISATNLVNVDAQGFGSRWALADPMAEADEDIDADFGTDGPDTLPADSDGLDAATRSVSTVKSAPGAVAILRGIKAVGTWAATGSDDFLKNLEFYIRAMAVATGTPLFEFDLQGAQPSGESRRRAEGRANKKARKVQRSAGAFFRDLADTSLALLGMQSEVTVNWRPVEVSTDKDGLELIALKIQNGVPIATALSEAGYDPEQIAEWYPEGDALHTTPELLELLARVLQSLGQAKTLGVIGDRHVAELLPALFGAAAEGNLALDDDDLGDDLDDAPTPPSE